MSGGAIVERLRAAATPLWRAQLEHPFVRGLHDGDLAPERFAHWLRQDYRYLQAHARAYALAAGRAADERALAWYVAGAERTLGEELALHRGVAADFGVTAAELEGTEPWPTTRAYGDFLLSTAALGRPEEIVCVLLPCERGYVEVARHLEGSPGARGSRYATWIEHYCAPGFDNAASWLEDELERLCEAPPPVLARRLEQLFLQSSRYEVAFWQMCWDGA